MRALTILSVLLVLLGCGSSTVDERRPPGGSIMDDLVAELTGERWKAAIIGANGGELSGYVVALELIREDAAADPGARELFDRGNRSADPAEALRLYEQAVAAAGDDPAILNNRGLQLLRLGRRDEARQAFRRAIISSPRFGPAEENLDRVIRRL